ncbi:MAG: signal recognition particle-docking protein FtsY [Halieaceae bacterium MED-G27]|jgi:fused signal recognition particle receptor|nr:signal recognition particle-docking protein FtsY [Halieaceae bacterium]OUT64995.1 MAG: signal recognition particle-docking protein FtsY [Cellvibrionales bacterium TMED21]PDH36637.1 MAG: signal recognition particle-docking protein FtsY [Halieaceae bacterium MED-G27]|tara:strand:- start:2745 stop:3752 length:1008 start_codon:yes stop_codon:yes gene_type:complete
MRFFGRKKTTDADEPLIEESADKASGDAGSSWFSRLSKGLGRTGAGFVSGLGSILSGRPVIDDELIEALETQLLMADVGVATTQSIIDQLLETYPRQSSVDAEAVTETLKQLLITTLSIADTPAVEAEDGPTVILVVGVNGAGKTTTIGKLAHRYLSQGKSVMLAAGDTFRAAAVEQLQTWGERNGVPVIAQHTGADSASVLFDAISAAKARNVDVLLADTAGRLNNKAHLMDELEKIVRVLKKADPEAPHETLLVLDAGTGQNAVAQAREFDASVGITGIALTKLDGTAKGGVVFAIGQEVKRPIRFIGIGEAVDDLRPFDAEDFVNALFTSVD